MNLCSFTAAEVTLPHVGHTLDEQQVFDLTAAGVSSLTDLLDTPDLPAHLRTLISRQPRAYSLADIKLHAPVEHQEVWAAGVTYLRSKKARMEESDFSATAYDRVYEAPRPELFFKAVGPKAVGPGGDVGIRADAKWNVPEPELALVLNRRGLLVGFTAGNDMSSRDIEGENLLYLPQAKVYDRSCALGPFIVVDASEEKARTWTIGVKIFRSGEEVFGGETVVDRIKRSFEELIGWLNRSQTFPAGAILLTGTGVVPANDFTLAEGDHVVIKISGVGLLENRVVVV
jgi:2-dehydro-3-deoxy-D-arabinonate dehydratase